MLLSTEQAFSGETTSPANGSPPAVLEASADSYNSLADTLSDYLQRHVAVTRSVAASYQAINLGCVLS